MKKETKVTYELNAVWKNEKDVIRAAKELKKIRKSYNRLAKIFKKLRSE